MSAGKRRLPNPATAMSATGMVAGLAALAISLSGIAGAASKGTVTRSDLAPGSVTARALARGAVHPKALADSSVISSKLRTGAVNKRVIKKGAVTPPAIAANAVTAGAIAPGSVYAGALAPRTLHVTSIGDLDVVAENGTWTAGDTGIAFCEPGEALLGTGFAMPDPGNREVSWLQVLPVLPSTGTGDAVNARYASNSGGTSEGQVVAICLK